MDRRVTLVGCRSYDPHVVELAVRRSLDLLGGMASFVQPGQRVLVKPNLLRPSPPEHAVITHPNVVRAVILLAQEAGGRVIVADSPAVPLRSHWAWRAAYERAGFAAVAAETGAELNTQIVPCQRANPDGRLVKILDLSTFLTEAQVVINVPKLKTHGLMRYTGAVKNLFGVVPGLTKAGYHAKLQTADHFADMLLDLASFVRSTGVLDHERGSTHDKIQMARSRTLGGVGARVASRRVRRRR
jgi:uncharacterized protein (DUF362 family)